jgi:predicted SprT family Zn-dependent metalloprotease
MFSTQEFFKNNPDKLLGSHSDVVSKWLLKKMRMKFSWLNQAIDSGKFNTDNFIKEWSEYLRNVTPFDIQKAWEYIDKERSNKMAPNLKEFKNIIELVKSRSSTYDELHQEALRMGAIVYGCRCGHCYENKTRISISPTQFYNKKLN